MSEPRQSVPNQVLPADAVPFDRLAEGFEAACGRLAPREFHVEVAGYPVHIRVAGHHWADLIERAISHLPAAPEGSETSLSIDAWDASEAGVALPSDDLSDAIESTILLRTSEDGAFIGERRNHGTTWFDREQSRIVACVRRAELLNLDERARPFHKLLSAWLVDRDVQFVHAGLVEHGGAGLLFVGNGGAGKSTSSISCLMDGMGFLGDDFIAISERGDQFSGIGLYATCLFNRDHIRRFPDLEPISRPGNYAYEDKRVVYLSECGNSAALKSEVPIGALLLPRVIGSGPTRAREASKAQTLLAIAPTSVMFLPRPTRSAFERLSRLVERTPCYWLELGEDVRHIPDAVRAVAAGLQ